MSDLSQKVKSLLGWVKEREILTLAKQGALAGVVGEAMLTGAVLITPELREIVIKDIGVPAYIGYLAVINAMGTLIYVGTMIPNYQGFKTSDNNNYVHT